VASARLAQLLLLEPTVDLQPADHAVLPIMLVPLDRPLKDLVAIGVSNRPEAAEGAALAGAAEARWHQARIAPFVPKVNVGYTSGGFGGGIDDELEAFRGRGDAIAMLTWELRGLGLGNIAESKTRRSQFDEAGLRIREIEARVAAEVTASAKVAAAHHAALAAAAESVVQAEETWKRLRIAAKNLVLAGGRFDPLEPLTAEQALYTARTHYLAEVIDFNRAQFRLYWAMGQPPACALPDATPIPLNVPVVPPPRSQQVSPR
jgi:outer membrane protein TolC